MNNLPRALVSWKFATFFLLFTLASIIGAHFLDSSKLKRLNSDLALYQINIPNRVAFQSQGNVSTDNVQMWMSFMTILSTLFAVFFVYSGFKIDSTKDKIDDAAARIATMDDKMNDDIEWANQLQYGMSFIIQKQYGKAIDAFSVLRGERFVLKNNDRLNSCFFLAHCYYERSLLEKEDGKKKEDAVYAVEFIDQAISDPSHPFKNEIINYFNRLDKKI